ncbi:hypothetical protein EI541_06635 [Xanthomonas citri pv. eucalyptorum]|nr:hypothetical protein EI541_06635 [Xanthomonas axonopodis pv. eucalyptorum]
MALNDSMRIVFMGGPVPVPVLEAGAYAGGDAVCVNAQPAIQPPGDRRNLAGCSCSCRRARRARLQSQAKKKPLETSGFFRTRLESRSDYFLASSAVSLAALAVSSAVLAASAAWSAAASVAAPEAA